MDILIDIFFVIGFTTCIVVLIMVSVGVVAVIHRLILGLLDKYDQM